jgi:hypothetical protein
MCWHHHLDPLQGPWAGQGRLQDRGGGPGGAGPHGSEVGGGIWM